MKNQKGFTLAELLIVVAIIAVLVAISIPIFTSQLENSREATDAANIRSAYAEVAAAALSNPKDAVSIDVVCGQTVNEWQNTNITDIAGIKIDSLKDVTAGCTVKVGYDGSTNGKTAKVYFQIGSGDKIYAPTSRLENN